MRLNWHGGCSSKLVVMSLLLCGPACILPPPIDEEGEDANRAPRIVPFLPTVDGEPVTLNCNGQPTTFLANLVDDNERDTLYYRFFIDYYRRSREDNLDTSIGLAPPTPTRPRRAQEDITVNNPTLLERPNDIHVIELYVVDREFIDSIDDPPSDVGRVTIEGGLTASYTWTVYPIECD